MAPFYHVFGFYNQMLLVSASRQCAEPMYNIAHTLGTLHRRNDPRLAKGMHTMVHTMTPVIDSLL
jgi:hypothetical protein